MTAVPRSRTVAAKPTRAHIEAALHLAGPVNRPLYYHYQAAATLGLAAAALIEWNPDATGRLRLPQWGITLRLRVESDEPGCTGLDAGIGCHGHPDCTDAWTPINAPIDLIWLVEQILDDPGFAPPPDDPDHLVRVYCATHSW